MRCAAHSQTLIINPPASPMRTSRFQSTFAMLALPQCPMHIPPNMVLSRTTQKKTQRVHLWVFSGGDRI